MLKTPLIAPLSQGLTPSLEMDDLECAPRCSAHNQRNFYLYFVFVAARRPLQTHFHGWRRAYFWMAFIRPPAEMMFWIKGGKGSAWNTLPLVSSVMTPVSKST